MKYSVFDYQSYKAYLNELIVNHPKRGRGLKTALAAAAPCQMTYVSRVLNGDRHFTFEQAQGISTFLGHTEDESRFFLLLLSLEKAGTPNLRQWYKKEIDREIQRHLTLKDRFKAKEFLTREGQATFYGNWYYTAIHIALTIPSLRTKEALAKAFGIKLTTVSSVLEFLTSVGLAEQRGTEFVTGVTNTYLGSDSPLINQHHTNWRMRAISSLDNHNQDDLHYSAVVTIPADEFVKIKSSFAKTIEEARKHWNEAKNETDVCAVSLDWFRLVHTQSCRS